MIASASNRKRFRGILVATVTSVVCASTAVVPGGSPLGCAGTVPMTCAEPVVAGCDGVWADVSEMRSQAVAPATTKASAITRAPTRVQS